MDWGNCPRPRLRKAQGPILKNHVSTIKSKIKDSYGAASNDMEISNLNNLSEKFSLENGVWLNLYQNASTVIQSLTSNPEEIGIQNLVEFFR